MSMNDASYSLFFPAAFALAHLARAARAIFARAAADIVRPVDDPPSLPFTFAQRNLWAAAILARPAADNLVPPRTDAPTPRTLANLLFNESIFPWRDSIVVCSACAILSCADV
jgi:hypothetical protein